MTMIILISSFCIISQGCYIYCIINQLTRYVNRYRFLITIINFFFWSWEKLCPLRFSWDFQTPSLAVFLPYLDVPRFTTTQWFTRSNCRWDLLVKVSLPLVCMIRYSWDLCISVQPCGQGPVACFSFFASRKASNRNRDMAILCSIRQVG